MARSAYRRSYRLPVRWRVQCKSARGEFAGTIRNASDRGFFVELASPAPVAVDTQLELDLDLGPNVVADSGNPRFNGHIVWRGFTEEYECHGIGVQLDEAVLHLESWHRVAFVQASA